MSLSSVAPAAPSQPARISHRARGPMRSPERSPMAGWLRSARTHCVRRYVLLYSTTRDILSIRRRRAASARANVFAQTRAARGSVARRRRAADARRRRLPTVPWRQPTATRLRRTLRHGTVLGRYRGTRIPVRYGSADCCTAAGAPLLVGRLAYHHERFSGASASTTARSLGTSREPTRSWSGCWMRSGVSRSAGDACDAHTRAVRIARTYHGPNYTP